MTTHAHTGRSGRVGPLTIGSIVLALLLPPIGFVLGFAAARRESNAGYVGVFLGGVGTVLGLIAGIAVISPMLPNDGTGASSPVWGFTIALLVLAVVSVVGSLAWARFTKSRDTGEGDATTGAPQRPTR